MCVCVGGFSCTAASPLDVPHAAEDHGRRAVTQFCSVPKKRRLSPAPPPHTLNLQLCLERRVGWMGGVALNMDTDI